MPWITGLAVVGGALLSSSATGKAASGQQDAANAATAEQRRQFDITQQNYKPYQDAGAGALQRLTGYGDYAPTPNAESVMSQPGYQFGLKQGLDSVEQGAAARGALYSGAAGKALTRYGNDYATTKYGDAWNQAQQDFSNRWNRLSNLAGLGSAANGQVNQAGQNYANQVGNIGMANANAQGASGITQANIWGNALNSFAPALKNWWQGDTTTGASGGGTAQPYADGGPVRVEPVVGTRTPRPTGTGGGLSRDEILRIIDAQPLPTPSKSGIALLPANPLTNPRAILADREQKAYAYGGAVDMLSGGAVRGPGGPRDDAIPADLSNGEHVVDADAVTRLGGGSNARGQRKMNAMRALMHRM